MADLDARRNYRPALSRYMKILARVCLRLDNPGRL